MKKTWLYICNDLNLFVCLNLYVYYKNNIVPVKVSKKKKSYKLVMKAECLSMSFIMESFFKFNFQKKILIVYIQHTYTELNMA